MFKEENSATHELELVVTDKGRLNKGGNEINVIGQGNFGWGRHEGDSNPKGYKVLRGWKEGPLKIQGKGYMMSNYPRLEGTPPSGKGRGDGVG